MIEFTEEQGLLALSAADFMQRHSSIEAVRRAMTTDSGFDPGVWRQLSELGWLGVSLPEAHGGAGLPVSALVCVAEAMGRKLYASPFLATTLAGQLLSRCGSEAQRGAWLPKLASGAAIGTVALTEEDGAWTLDAPSLSARSEGEGFVLRGSKLHVLDAAAADLIIVSASLDSTPALFALERAALPEDALRRHVLIDETRRAYRLQLDDLPVPATARLSGGDAADGLTHVARVGTLLVAAEQVGATESVMQLTLDYLRTRTQFGRPIGSYQALKHPMVDIMIAQECNRSLLYRAATAFDGDPVQAEVALRMAKAEAGDGFCYAADRAIQFHGGIGFTYECHAQLFFRRAQWTQYSFGDAIHHRGRLQPLLLDSDAFFQGNGVGPAGLSAG